MNGCEGCWTSAKGQDEALSNMLEKAKDYAKENSMAVAVYKEGFEYKIIEAGSAIMGGYNIVEVVSQYQ